MNGVLDGERAPAEWCKSLLLPVPKKPGTLRIEEHRGIALMSCATKIFNKILLRWVQPVLERDCRVRTIVNMAAITVVQSQEMDQ